jgi:hypothetical protein
MQYQQNITLLYYQRGLILQLTTNYSYYYYKLSTTVISSRASDKSPCPSSGKSILKLSSKICSGKEFISGGTIRCKLSESLSPLIVLQYLINANTLPPNDLTLLQLLS